MTTDAHSSEVLVPRVLWAQRHDKVYLTIEVFGVKDEQLDVTPTSLSFSGVRSEDNAHFAVALEFFAPIDCEKLHKNVSPRNVSVILYKQDTTQSYWPRLVKDSKKLHYIAIDFSKWVDEDDEGTGEAGADSGMGDFGGFPGFDPSQFAGMNDGNYDDDLYGADGSSDDEANGVEEDDVNKEDSNGGLEASAEKESENEAEKNEL